MGIVMADDVIVRNGEGSFNGALSLPWWEIAGRLSIGLWLLVPGLLVAFGNIFQLAGQESLVLAVAVTGIALGCLFIVAAILSFSGRFGVSGFILLSTLVFDLFQKGRAAVPSQSDAHGPGALFAWLQIALAAAALTWIAGRRMARSGPPGALQKGAAVTLAVVFLLCVPAEGYSLGTGVGTLLSPAPTAANRVRAGQRLPRTRVQALDGGQAQLNERGVLYVVNFWATWCGPCRMELPRLLAASRDWPKDAAIRLVAVNTENLDRETIGAFLEKEKLTDLPVYVDPQGLKESLGYDSIPLTLLLKDGQVLAVHSGYSSQMLDALSEEIRQALGAQARPAL